MANFKTVCKSSVGKLELTVKAIKRIDRDGEWIIAGKFVHSRAMVNFTGIKMSDADIKHVMVQNSVVLPMTDAIAKMLPEVKTPQLSWHKNAMGGNPGWVVVNSNIQCDLTLTLNVGKAPVKLPKVEVAA